MKHLKLWMYSLFLLPSILGHLHNLHNRFLCMSIMSYQLSVLLFIQVRSSTHSHLSEARHLLRALSIRVQIKSLMTRERFKPASLLVNQRSNAKPLHQNKLCTCTQLNFIFFLFWYNDLLTWSLGQIAPLMNQVLQNTSPIYVIILNF